MAAAQHLDAVGFHEVPQPVGFLVHHDGDRQLLLASVTRFLPGAIDGWDWYVDDLLAWLDGGLSDPAMPEPATALGALVGRMHVAFATAWAQCPTPVAPASAGRRRALATSRARHRRRGGCRDDRRGGRAVRPPGRGRPRRSDGRTGRCRPAPR